MRAALIVVEVVVVGVPVEPVVAVVIELVDVVDGVVDLGILLSNFRVLLNPLNFGYKLWAEA